MDSTTRFSTQRVGALPVVVAYLEKMQLADMIDTHVPWEGEVSPGMLIEIMVCNRLLNPKAQSKIGEWAERAGVCGYYNVTPEQLNDDRLGRMLPTKRLVYAADTKFDAPENLLTNKAAGGQFLCGGVFQPHLIQLMNDLQAASARFVSCIARSSSITTPFRVSSKRCRMSATIAPSMMR